MKNYFLRFIPAALLLLNACDGKRQQVLSEGTDAENYVMVTRAQFETGKMSIGDPVRMIFEETIMCNGRIEAEPSADAMISSVIPGLVKEIFCTEGQKVTKGEALFELTGNEFIELQKNLAETASRIMRFRSEYERTKTLYGDKIGSEKELIMAESEFRASNANYSALKIKAEMLGLEISRIENGEFYESFLVRSPINGYVSDIYVSLGQYVDQHTAMTDVYDADRLHLKLAVFEKDIRQLRVGQKVKFSLPGDNRDSYTATMHSVGRNVDEETKTILCCAEIDNCCSTHFVHNAFVKAEVISGSDSLYALPEDAILQSEGNSYIFVQVKTDTDRYFLQRLSVQTGRNNNGFIEILDLPANQKLVIGGAYNLRVEQ